MSTDPTKARLIQAAGEEFAEKGFDGATVRSICNRAGTNLAAVNYHFGDKERLYEHAMLEAHRCGRFAQVEDVFAGGSPVEQFRSYVRWFLANVFDNLEQGWHRPLMLRELIHPTSASDVVVREAIRPRFDHLKAILRRFCPEADERRLNALAFSVVGQVLHYKVARTISERLIGPESLDDLDLDYLADHVADFCLAALGQVPALDATGEPGPAPDLARAAEEAP